jgi:hypothetical protein
VDLTNSEKNRRKMSVIYLNFQVKKLISLASRLVWNLPSKSDFWLWFFLKCKCPDSYSVQCDSRYIKHNGMEYFLKLLFCFHNFARFSWNFHSTNFKELSLDIASQLRFRYDFRNAFIPLCKAKCRQLELEIVFYSLCLKMVSYPPKIVNVIRIENF